MKLPSLSLSTLLILSSSSSTTNAFQVSQFGRKGQLSTLRIQHHHNDNDSNGTDDDNNNNAAKLINDWKLAGAGLVTAATIATTATTASISLPQPANALELSTGAFVIETTTPTPNGGTKQNTLSAASIDSQSLLKTLFTNRKALTSSLQRIGSAIETEYTTQPVYKELQKEVLEFEGDVVPTIQIKAPSDIRQTVKDVSQGKVNFLINGEIVNVVVEPNFGKEEDDLIIKISGFKGENLTPKISEPESPKLGPIRSKLSELTGLWDFWNGPAEYLPGTIEATNGQVVLAGTAGSIAAIYGGAYSYYISEQEKEAAAADAKRQMMKERAAEKKRKADVIQKAKEAEKASQQAAEEEKALKKATMEKVKREKEAAEAAAAAAKAKQEEAAAVEDSEETEESGNDNEEGKRRRRFRFWKKD